MGGRQRTILVFDGDKLNNWPDLFAQGEHSDSLRVVQASWIESSLTSYPDSGCYVTLAPIHDSGSDVDHSGSVTVKPDIVVMRNQPRGAVPGTDARNMLFGLMHAGVPSVNSLESEYMQLERPIMFGGLREIEKRLGWDAFPLIQQTYYSSHNQMIISPDPLPAIVKVGHAHAGHGKLRVDCHRDFLDVGSLMSLHNDHCTGEPFVEAEYGIRVQRIGKHYRCYHKLLTGASWTTHQGGSVLQCVPLTEEYKRWADEAAQLFGGLDLCAVDGLHGKDGKDYIIELNGSSIGLLPEYWEEDSIHVRDLVLERMQELGMLPDKS